MWTEYADCPTCDRPVAVYTPRHGDGTIRLTHWHKRDDDQGGRRWCRAELDIGDHDIRNTRRP
ncbi:hypothetical protein [Kitasatospora sp. NPDC090091]|uniref:hypothetical protein n=1 Tax=Kitasatospora sp. NPDC090091 TaxID=3364081 RepID=UPI0037F89117